MYTEILQLQRDMSTRYVPQVTSTPTSESEESKSLTDHLVEAGKHSRSKPHIISEGRNNIHNHFNTCHSEVCFPNIHTQGRSETKSLIRNNYKYNKINDYDEPPLDDIVGSGHIIPIQKFELFERFFSELNRKESNFLYFSLLCAICISVLRLILYLFIADIIDLFADYDTYHGSIHSICSFHPALTQNCNIHVFMGTLLIVCLAISLLKIAQNLSTSAAASSFVIRLNCIVFETIIHQNISFFGRTEKMYLNKLLSTDMKHINLSVHSMILIIQNIIHFIGGIIFLFCIHFGIAFIVICSFIILLIIIYVYTKQNIIIDEKRTSKFKLVVIKITEMINYITTIKIFSKEDDETWLYQHCIKDAYKYHTKRDTLLYQYLLKSDITIHVTMLTIIYYAKFKIVTTDPTMTIGTLIIVLFIVLQLKKAIKNIVTAILLFLDGYIQSARHIYSILVIENDEEKISIVQNEEDNPIVNKEIIGEIEMKNVQFAYPNINRLVLEDICITCEPSSLTALVGVSGAGKSTILDLLMRFFDAQKGQILIDGMNIVEYDLSFLHSNIGFVGQNINLFEHRTIGENIKFAINYGTKNHYKFDLECFDDSNLHKWKQMKTMQQDSNIENAAKNANAYEFIRILGQQNNKDKQPVYCMKITRDIRSAELDEKERDNIITKIKHVLRDNIVKGDIVKGDIGDDYNSNVILCMITTKNDDIDTDKIETILTNTLNVPVEMKQRLNYFQIGCDTVIGGKDGIQLSHGEKQRIGIARAVLFNPKILLLDEAMESLDDISVQKSLDTLMMEQKRCVVVIAHRLSTVKNAKMIYVLNDGKIDDFGTHNELIKKNGLYSKLLERHIIC